LLSKKTTAVMGKDQELLETAIMLASGRMTITMDKGL
jgi:hypothetical protein